MKNFESIFVILLLLFCQICATIKVGLQIPNINKENSMEISERELAQFLDDVKNKELATWQRRRTSEELGSFVARRLAALDRESTDIDLAI